MDKYEVLTNIQIHTDKFNETKFFPHAMQVFILANSNGLPIPKEILDAIEKGFVEWAKYDGRKGKGLDDIFGLNPGCSGHTTVLTNTWTESRTLFILSEMELLNALGLNKTRAADAVYLWLCKQYKEKPKKYRWLKPNNSGRKNGDSEACSVIASDTIKKNIWDKRKSTYLKIYEEAQKDVAQRMVSWSDERKQKFLDSYLNLFPSGERIKIRISPPKPLDDYFEKLVVKEEATPAP
ncbi:MAG: hypothetical protein JSR51_05350 [Proteobacteria bacterium]|nr:hypothetical protein [Pseudomonadota bacterium]